MRKSRILAVFCALVMVVNLATTAFAADVSYNFNLSNTGTTMVRSTGTNQKVIANNAATIRCANTNALGWGYYMRLHSTAGNQLTYSYWYNNTNNLRHPSYLNPSQANLKYYYIEGRIDNDYGGPFSISGTFNADET